MQKISCYCISFKTMKIGDKERSKEEVIHFMKQRTARPETEVYNPAFDVTPHQLITAVITEEKVLYPDFKEAIAQLPR